MKFCTHKILPTINIVNSNTYILLTPSPILCFIGVILVLPYDKVPTTYLVPPLVYRKKEFRDILTFWKCVFLSTKVCIWQDQRSTLQDRWWSNTVFCVCKVSFLRVSNDIKWYQMISTFFDFWHFVNNFKEPSNANIFSKKLPSRVVVFTRPNSRFEPQIISQ